MRDVVLMHDTHLGMEQDGQGNLHRTDQVWQHSPAQGMHLTASRPVLCSLGCSPWSLAAGSQSWLLTWSFQTATSIKRSNFR